MTLIEVDPAEHITLVLRYNFAFKSISEGIFLKYSVFIDDVLSVVLGA